MADYKLDSVVQVGNTKQMAQWVEAHVKKLEANMADLHAEQALRGVDFVGNTLKFFTTTDTSATAAFAFDLPVERYLDQTKTRVENNFVFDSDVYVGATNPTLDGKPVMVFAVKSREGLTESINYSFLDYSPFMGGGATYTASDTSIFIDSDTNKIRVGISAQPFNAITKKQDGLHVDVSDKVDKLTGATAGHIPVFVAGGNISDTGIAFATSAEFEAMLNEVFPTTSGGGN